MGYLRVASYPIQVLLRHNDVVIEWVDDGYADLNPVYTINGIEWQELSGNTWLVRIERSGQSVFNYEMSPLETDSWNIPTPQRFRSDQLENRITLVRA